MNLTRLSTSAGVDYLLNTVAPGDGRAPAKAGGLTAYYAEAGTPPGTWWGRGAQAAEIDLKETITAQGANRLFKDFSHPVTGELLGARPRRSGATAGFDLTFTIPKSVSALWAVAPAHVQDAILAAHQEAISHALTYVEDRVLQTRSGHAGVATVATRGMIAGRFDHFDSREGDPHLHTHVVVSNKVQRAGDGKWLTVDSRALHKAAVSVSELHQNLLLDELHRSLGLEFEERRAEGSRAVVPDVTGVPEDLLGAFSTRDRQIRAGEAEAIAAWAAEHDGQMPTGQDLARIHQTVWRATRKPKPATPTPLAQLRARWRTQVHDAGIDVDQMVAASIGRSTEADLATGNATSSKLAADYAALTLDGFAQEHASTVVDQIRASRSTWTIANLRAETERLTRNVRCESPDDRRKMVDAVVEAAASVSVELSRNRYQLTPEAAQDVRLALRGRSIFDDDHARVFTDTSILNAEAYLMGLATKQSGPRVATEVSSREVARASATQLVDRGFAFADDQCSAAHTVITDGKALSAIVGPAGTGKSTTMKAVKAAWEAAHGTGTITGLTTSAQAAAVLGAEIETEAHTVAKWLYESVGEGARRRTEQLAAHQAILNSANASKTQRARAARAIAPLLARNEQWRIRKNQLLIVDEASMTGTHALAELSRQAHTAGAKVLLVGDPAQLDAVDAGGVLGWLDRTNNAVSLTSVWRFTNDWEKNASLALRAGAPSVIDTYLDHDRIRNGDDETILEEAFQATRDDQTAGRTTILVAATNQVAADLNQRFTLERRASGEVSIDTLTPLRGGTSAGVGETVLARKVDRTLRDSAGDFIRNGTQLTVTGIRGDQVLATRSDNNATIALPRNWVEAHVELGYAITAHRAQGTTVDVGHVAIPSDSTMTRELLYVAMTRGRENNLAWVGEQDPTEGHDQLMPAAEIPNWRTTINGIVQTSGAEHAAHEVREQVSEEYQCLSRLLAERAHLLSLLSATKTTDMLQGFTSTLRSHLGEERTTNAAGSERFTALAAEFARLEGLGIDTEPFLQDVAGARELITADDVARVLLWRIETWGRVQEQTQPSIDVVDQRDPQADDRPLQNALNHSATLIDARVRQLHRDAPSQRWATESGIDPAHPARERILGAIAVYRDTYSIRDVQPLGGHPPAQDRDRTAHWQQLQYQLHQARTATVVNHVPTTTQIRGTAIGQQQAQARPTLR